MMYPHKKRAHKKGSVVTLPLIALLLRIIVAVLGG
jgi:hypothetical protein